MSEKSQKLRIGIFIIAGTLLMLAVLFFLGLSDMFVEKVTLVTRFNESVQGLTVGSPVKYRGVQVGTVSKISIVMQKKTVWVAMEIEPRYFRGVDKDEFENAFRKELANGLACRMEFAGITGMKFIDLDYFSTANTDITVPSNIPLEEAIYVASVPSAFQDFSKAVVNAMERLSKIRFEEISAELEQSIITINTLLADPAIKSTISKINEAAENLESSTATINQAINEERIATMLDDVEKNLKSLNKLTSTLNRTSAEMKLPESSRALRNAADSISESQKDLTTTLEKLNRTLDSMKLFFDYIEKDPSSIIRGKKPEKSILK
ncbi:MAG: MCE family protein [Lentisphaeria bacterium]|nr:MCE family protein [Lentisphaeria bacterium]